MVAVPRGGQVPITRSIYTGSSPILDQEEVGVAIALRISLTKWLCNNDNNHPHALAEIVHTYSTQYSVNLAQGAPHKGK